MSVGLRQVPAPPYPEKQEWLREGDKIVVSWGKNFVHSKVVRAILEGRGT